MNGPECCDTLNSAKQERKQRYRAEKAERERDEAQGAALAQIERAEYWEEQATQARATIDLVKAIVARMGTSSFAVVQDMRDELEAALEGVK